MKAHPIHSDYMITEDGDVYSSKFGKIKKRKIYTNNKGYMRIVLCNDGKLKNYMVHRLVAETYIPNTNNLPQVNHIDEDKTNNNVSNLEWCSRQYNNEYSKAMSWIVENVRTGERQTIYNMRAFCRQLGLTQGGLYHTLKGRQLDHKGYKIIERIERTD